MASHQGRSGAGLASINVAPIAVEVAQPPALAKWGGSADNSFMSAKSDTTSGTAAATFRADREDTRRRKAQAREARRAQRARKEAASPRLRRLRLALTVVLALALLGASVAALGAWHLTRDMPQLPSRAAMWEVNLQPTVTLLDRNGAVLGQRGPGIGRPRSLSELPRHVPDAVLAIEDERFFEHEGVDRRAILRALLTNLRAGERAQGGSTLTQQLVKTMVLSPDKTYRRKFQEAVLAARLEEVLSKPEILELYINRTVMGKQVFGVEAASQTYFGHPATELTLGEAALLAAIPQAPSRLDPREHFGRAWERAEAVLARMLANGLASPEEVRLALANPPEIVSTRPGLSEDVLGWAFDRAAEEAKTLLEASGNGAVQDLVITTTLDPEWQRAGHAALDAVLDKSGESRRVSEAALVAVDNATGGVRALVGGRSYAASKFDRAVQAQRQPGSSFKAFVYAAALEDGFTPGTVRMDQPLTIGSWTPENYTERFRGPMTLREALKLSINTVAAQVGAEVGPSRVAALSRRFGIQTPLQEVYSLALGSSEVNLLELTSAFSVFPNAGLRRPPHLVTEVTDSAGRTLFRRRPRQPERVYSPDLARQMNVMLREVVEDGTAYGARVSGRQVAGKTGTSQDYRDAWFVGYSAQATAGVWMGNDDNTLMREVTGGLLPADAWKTFMREVHEGLPSESLPLPRLADLSPFRQAVTEFYAGLSEELEEERNVAAGISQ